ncbi:hypothetical protein GALL_461800 [mine drainage metagenome]|uniref:DUF4381 domain-containing protein n=1 Tax=mine drainage metagenome TaxID=410659 RepID=A0A1J5Q8C5_9ZZZZ
MDRIAALADIILPAPPPLLPPAAWWQLPAVWLAAALVALAAAWALLWFRRSRTLRRLGGAATQAAGAPGRTDAAGSTEDAATALAAHLRAVLPEADWPPALSQTLDALRFAPLSAPDAQAALHRLAAAIQVASRQAARAAWWRSTLPQTVFACALHAAARSGDAPPTVPNAVQGRP